MLKGDVVWLLLGNNGTYSPGLASKYVDIPAIGDGIVAVADKDLGPRFKPLLTAAGLPDMRFHDLRHT